MPFVLPRHRRTQDDLFDNDDTFKDICLDDDIAGPAVSPSTISPSQTTNPYAILKMRISQLPKMVRNPRIRPAKESTDASLDLRSYRPNASALQDPRSLEKEKEDKPSARFISRAACVLSYLAQASLLVCLGYSVYRLHLNPRGSVERVMTAWFVLVLVAWYGAMWFVLYKERKRRAAGFAESLQQRDVEAGAGAGDGAEAGKKDEHGLSEDGTVVRDWSVDDGADLSEAVRYWRSLPAVFRANRKSQDRLS